jgi:hypothetical protein
MTRNFSILAIAPLIFAVSSQSTAQNQRLTGNEVKSIPFRLLPGYRLKVDYGIDSMVEGSGRVVASRLCSAKVYMLV